MKTKQVLTLEDACRIADGAAQEAQRNGWPVTIAVCDDGGHLLLLQRLDGAPLMSAEIAPAKARAAVLARKSSKALEEMVNNGRFAALAMPISPLEGGEMVVVGGAIVGGIGISGVKAPQDAQVARAGVAAIGGSCEL